LPVHNHIAAWYGLTELLILWGTKEKIGIIVGDYLAKALYRCFEVQGNKCRSCFEYSKDGYDCPS
jgi:hypothetical protein